MPKKRARRGRKQQIGAIVLLLMGMGALVLAGGVLARYVLFWDSEGAVAQPDAFYFTSDLLTETGSSYDVFDWGDGIPIEIKNYEDAKRVTASDITYEVTCAPDGVITDQNGAALSGSIKISGKSAADSLIVILPQDKTAKEIRVTVTSTAPYRKTLTATFQATGTRQLRYRVDDAAGSSAAKLLVMGGPVTKTVTLTWSAGLAPDRTEPDLKFGGGASATLEVPAGVSYSILLFKDDPSRNYSAAEQDLLAEKSEIKLG